VGGNISDTAPCLAKIENLPVELRRVTPSATRAS
jgi:hypothetical protein